MGGGAQDRPNDPERIVVDRIGRGEPAIFLVPPVRRPNVRASLLRRLLLSPPPRNGGGEWPGVRISGACIDGPLVVVDCAQPGAGLAALPLESRDIRDPVTLSASRLVRLSLAHSQASCESQATRPIPAAHAPDCRTQWPRPARCW